MPHVNYRVLTVALAGAALIAVPVGGASAAGSKDTRATASGKQAKGPTHRRSTPRERARVRAFARKVTYTGQTGAILHLTTTQTEIGREAESWVEIDGGQRYHTVNNPNALGTAVPDRGRVLEEASWGSPLFDAYTDVIAYGKRTTKTSRIIRKPEGSGGAAYLDTFRFIPAAQAAAQSAPAGPVVSGRATREVRFEDTTIDYSILLDAGTNVPVRASFTYKNFGRTDLPVVGETYAIRSYELLPAGGDGKVLSRPIPAWSKLVD